MKGLIHIFAFCLAFSIQTLAQGTFIFQNVVPDELNAPIYEADGTPLRGDKYRAVLYLGLEKSSLAPELPTATFLDSDAGAGYFIGGILTSSRIVGGIVAWAEVRAWNTEIGITYQEAAARGLGGYGKSEPFQVVGGTGPGHPSAVLIGLESFSLLPVVPEPGTVGMLVLGAVIFLPRRRGIPSGSSRYP